MTLVNKSQPSSLGRSPLTRWQPSRWLHSWVLIRNTALLAAIYLAGHMLVSANFVLWFYLTLEATNRYFPAWLQVLLVTFLGWQIDVLLGWPLGSGVALATAVMIWLRWGRSWRQAPTFVMWRLLGWLLFNFGLSLVLTIPILGVGWWLQTIFYLLLIILLWRRGR